MSVIYLDQGNGGAFVEDAAIFEFQDRLRLGDGVFDTALVVAGQPQHHGVHIARVLHDAGVMGIANLPEAAALREAGLELLKRHEIAAGARYALNTLITRGVAARGLMPAADGLPTVTMRLAPVPDEFPPIDAVVAKSVRRNEGSPLSQIKSCNYGDNILALMEAQQKGANEAILLNNAGRVACASAGNIFACIDGVLVTPPLGDGVMDGIMRGLVIDKYAAVVRSITPDELRAAQGIYITNSIKGAMPVMRLDGVALPEPVVKIRGEI
ncbi:MAG: aminotransferase class IV [Alphaproteobacteria bacterium]